MTYIGVTDRLSLRRKGHEKWQLKNANWTPMGKRQGDVAIVKLMVQMLLKRTSFMRRNVENWLWDASYDAPEVGGG